MTLLYSHPLFLEHQTGAHHPERPERLPAVLRQLERTGLDRQCRAVEWSEAGLAQLTRVHAAGYVQSLDDFCQQGGGRIEEDTVCSPRSAEAARLAAGATCDAVTRVLAGEARTALCLVRPPGHHALPESAMGFCLFNNVAVAARQATAGAGLSRVLVVDWDVHHGNGTQDMFWEDPQVAFLSIHRWPFYPGTGRADETGTGDALGTKLNLPVEFGTSRSDYVDRFRQGLEQLAAKTRPELVILSAGFDAHRDDPVGSLGLEIEDFISLTQAVLDVANVYANGRVVSVLEGGYNTGALAGCVEVHLRELLAHDAGGA